jgi:uncharacterized protein YfdQ (DUF2303 family)
VEKRDFTEHQTNADASIAAGHALATAEHERDNAGKIFEVDGFIPYRVDSDGNYKPVLELLKHPLDRKGDAVFYTARSFGDYVNRFKNPTTLIFADKVGRKFTALLDHHEAGGEGAARLGHFTAQLPLRHTPSWTIWTGSNKKAMSQADFAQFLEDNLPDIAEPAGATIVEIARTLEAKKNVQFQSSMRAEDGSHHFEYQEEVKGTARRGEIDIPDQFTLGLRPFEGSEQYAVKARFRFRIREGALALWYDLIRIDDILDGAFIDEYNKVAAIVKDTPIYEGPAAAQQRQA